METLLPICIVAAVLLVIFDGVASQREPTEAGWGCGYVLAALALIGLVIVCCGGGPLVGK